MFSNGATVFVSTQCTAGHRKVWSSLEQQSSQHWNGNIAIAASILISGSSYQPFRDAMDIAKVKMSSKGTFFTINNVYQRKRHEILERTKKSKNICLVGDGRCDSPGFSATYGTYTLMNEINNIMKSLRMYVMLEIHKIWRSMV